MSAVGVITQNPHLVPLVQQLCATRGWEWVRLTTAANWHQDPPAQRLDVCIADAALLHPESLHSLHQLWGGCEVIAHLEGTDATLLTRLLEWRVYSHVSLSDAAPSPADALRLTACIGAALERCSLRREQVELRKKLAARDEIFDLVGRATHDGLWEWDLVEKKIFFSQRWKAMLGYGPEELSNEESEWFERVHPEERDQLREEINVHLERLTEYFQSQHRVRHKGGQYRWMLSRGQALRDATGAATKLVGSHTDITTQKVSEERLLHEAFHDALTGLPNNALLRDRLQRAAVYAKRRPDYMYAVLFLDIDRFKNINESLGHPEGDQLLIAMAERLRNCVRPADLVARLGGDEFTVLLDNIGDRQEATRTAERMQRALALPFRLGKQEIYVSASIGIAVSSENQADPYDLVRDADTAMYRAKSRKNGVFEVFDASMHTHAVQRLGLETALRRAVSRQELKLHYQPIVDLKTARLAGFEALLRWHSEERGNIPPSDFIPLAEETGLIIPIGRWVLLEACRQMTRWQQSLPAARDLFVSVNISSRQFTQADLVDQISWVLEETRFAAKLLKLELTESLLIDNLGSTAVMMQKLKAMDVRLCIDDFGTGYSSLSTLYQLPIHTLKVDRSFVGRLGTHNTHGQIVDTIIMLAHTLKMDVIAEGIETPLQLGHLHGRGCDYGQGYLFSKPVPVDEAEALIASAKTFL